MDNFLLLSFLGGMLPAIFWLEFWLRQSTHREPRHFILGAFFLGMASVLVAGPLENLVNRCGIYEHCVFGMGLREFTFVSFLLWALIEEGVKFLGAYFSGLRTRFCDDAIDPAIYIITSALGFAAAENIVYLYDAFAHKGVNYGFTQMTSRFVGATILHIIASGTIGISMGIAFYKSKTAKIFAFVTGLILAVVLHAVFNSFIITVNGSGNSDNKLLWVFSVVWVLLIVVILALEKLKSTKIVIQN